MLVILVVTGTHWRQRVMHDALGEADRRRLAEQLAVDTNKTALPQTEQNYLKKKKGGLSVFRTRFRGYRSAAMKSVFERCTRTRVRNVVKRTSISSASIRGYR